MRTESKKVLIYLSICIVAILITFAATASMIIYSFSDHGQLVSESIELENARINLLQNPVDNTIKLQCVNTEETLIEEYILILMNDKQKTLSEIPITIDFSLEEQPIYQANCELTEVCFWKLEKD